MSHNSKIDKHHLSDVDQFLNKFNAEHPLSESQKKEINKHKHIFELRNNRQPAQPVDDIWEDF